MAHNMCIFCNTYNTNRKNKICCICSIISKYIDNETFILLCTNITHKHYNKKITTNYNVKINNNILIDYYEFKFNNYFHRFNKVENDDKKITFLKRDEYYSLLNNKCYYCNKDENKTVYLECDDTMYRYLTLCIECVFIKEHMKSSSYDIKNPYSYNYMNDFIDICTNIYLSNKNNINKLLNIYLYKEKNKQLKFITNNDIIDTVYTNELYLVKYNDDYLKKYIDICNEFYTSEFYYYLNDINKHIELNYDENIFIKYNKIIDNAEIEFFEQLHIKMLQDDFLTYKIDFNKINIINNNLSTIDF